MLMKPLRVAVIFVEAALEVCLDRVARRAQLTGRPVQEDFVRRCNEGCVKSAYAVKDFVDLFVHIRNNGQVEFIQGAEADVHKFTMTALAEQSRGIKDQAAVLASKFGVVSHSHLAG
uniref:Uncharacterized protein n=1 Tax=Zooxanthella nutricula TaxID=1333877 RepID=A0A7S2H871_9DINO